MASFNTAYGLCSVIDSRGLLGVCNDEDGCAVITIGKNMVIRCRFSDQKQLNSWSTRISKLTSKVVYDSVNGNYVGVFDNNHIKIWTTSESSIEKLKKRSVKNKIHEILLHKKSSFSKPSLFLLYKNGSCMELESALKCKEEIPGILRTDEVIEMADIITQEDKFLIIVVQYQNKYHSCYSVKLEEDSYAVIPKTVRKVKLRRPGAQMLGYCIMKEDKGDSLLTYWTDGFLYSLPLPIKGENSVGKFFGTIHTVSKNFGVAMVPLSYTQIALYASDSAEEGAFLGIYNVKFGLFQAQTSFKLYNKPPRIWAIENSIVMLMGQRLVCVPFTLQDEVLSALACSRALHNKTPTLTQEIAAVIPTVSWENTDRKVFDNQVEGPEKIKELLSVCASEGWSEYGISQFVLSKLLETKDYTSLTWCLDTFIDIPEDFIVKLLVLVLNDKDNVEVTDGTVPTSENFKTEFVDKILGLPMNDSNLLASLRLYFKFEDCISLLEHLCLAWEKNECNSNILAWTLLLLDAFYQQFILSRDENILEILIKMGKTIKDEIDCMNNLKTLLPLLINVLNGKEIVKSQIRNQSYTVERFLLY